MKKKQLKKLLKQANAALAAQSTPTDTSPLISEWIPTYISILAQRKYAAQTMKNRSANVRHVERLWGHHRIGSLLPFEVSSKLREYAPAQASAASRVLSELRDFYTEAVANGVTHQNPCAHVKPPKHSTLRARLSYADWDAAQKHAQSHPQKWVWAMMLLALVTGQRRADLAKMRFEDIYEGCLHVEQQKKAGKTYGARVAIPLDLKLDVLGVTLLDVVELCRSVAKPGPTLLRKAGGGALELSSLSARFHECLSAVKDPDAYEKYSWPSLHEVRSLSCRLYDAQGVDVQTLLGHKHKEMTAIYLDDRGLSSHIWKRVKMPSPQFSTAP